jgi:hypothetical protein
MKEIEIGNVKQMSRTGGALVAKNATALSAMLLCTINVLD